MEKIKSRTDKYGMEHLKFQQYYKGVKVEGGTYVLHLKNGIITSANGSFLKIDDLDIKPSIEPEHALSFAIEKGKKYVWESEEIEATLKENKGDPSATNYPKPELVIWHPYKENTPVLAYKIKVFSLEPDNLENIYIDAQKGNILHREPLTQYSNVSGGGTTRYSLGKSFWVFEDSEDHFILKDTHVSGFTLHTWNLQGYTSGYTYSQRIDFENDNSAWSDQTWDDWSEDKNNAALDAHWALQRIYDYFNSYYSWESYDGNNSPVNCYVHHGGEWCNAMWQNNAIYLGDGDDEIMDAVTTFDIIAHEFGHGINQSTCNVHGSLESNSISEGLSDIWGAIVELRRAQSAGDNDKDWLEIGEEMLLTNTLARSLRNPNLYNDPDTYLGNYWGSDPHDNNGVLNYWFYLLADGDSGTNDNDDWYNVNDIGEDRAALLVFTMEANEYLNNDADFDDARTASLQAANSLSFTAQEIQTIKEAWFAVGLGSISPTLSGPDFICTNNVIEVEDAPSWTDEIIWTCSSNITRVSAQGANPCTFSHNDNGDGWIQAEIVTTHNDSYYTPVKYVWAGEPVITSIDGVSSTTVDEEEGFHMNYDSDSSPTTFYWGVTPNPQGLILDPYAGYNWTYITFPEADDYTVYAMAINTCGSSNQLPKYVTVTESKSAKIPFVSIDPQDTESNLGLIISPNPASNQATVSFARFGLLGDSWSLEIYGPSQNLITEINNLKSAQIKINTQNWADGVYFVRASAGGQMFTKKLVLAK